ncbi:dihydrodipicolinate synthase family protein [Actinomadura madurae]|uniref:dihydrodipicolinate synthase family protein n=1 Tax=Actinomadura madurae TaxID=1993 RepID=UPI0020D2037E|nr:dihydrodipicolinate synthase family protein [Actinomadura madurae]MCQ0018300.1 dihydrodipicolinate synthase family protein [Actinomadura madurae]
MSSRHVLLATLIAALWGFNFVPIKVALDDLPPLLMGAVRFTAAAVPAVFLVRRPPVAARWLVLVGVPLGVGQFGLLFLGMNLGMPAGLASVVLQVQAIFTALFAFLLLRERPGARQIAGMVVAFGGVALLGVAQAGGGSPVGAFLISLAAAASWGLANVAMRRMNQAAGEPVDAFGFMVWMSLVPPLPLFALSLIFEGPGGRARRGTRPDAPGRRLHGVHRLRLDAVLLRRLGMADPPVRGPHGRHVLAARPAVRPRLRGGPPRRARGRGAAGRRRADHRGGRGGQPPPAAPHSRGRGPPVGPRHRSGTNEVRPMHGIHASLVTPFTRSGEVDAKSLERLAVHCLDNGADGLVALGTTGEAALLSAAERRTVLEVCRAVSLEHGTPLTVGAGTMGTEDSIRQARERAPLADALLVVVPYYLRPSDEGVVDHFAAVGAAVDVPSSPTTCRTGRRSPLPAETLLRILALDCVAGMKHCAGAIDQDTLAVLASRPDKAVLCGDDAYIYPMLQLGASGGVAACACLAPGAYAAMAEAARHGNAARALALHNALLPMAVALFSEPSPAVLKACLAEQGLIDDPAVRAPLHAPRPEPVSEALAAFRAVPL